MIARLRRDASSVRIPPVQPGTALIVTRYEEEKAVVLSPSDFERLAALDAALTEIEAGERPTMSTVTRRAHALEDEPGDPLEDATALQALLGR
jgi:hypothetical protein